MLGKGAILSSPSYAPDGMPIFSLDGLHMAIPTSARIYLYNATNLEEQYSIPVGTPFIAFSPDSRLLAASQPVAVSLWDPATGVQKGELLGDPGDVLWEVSFSPDGSLLAAVTWNRQVYIWSLADGERRFTLPGDRLRFSPDGELAVTVVYGENQVHLYETSNGTETNKWDMANAGFTPGGQLWLEDGETVRIADTDRDLMTAPFKGSQPSFSADGSLMALYDQGHIWLYDPNKGRRIQALEGSFESLDGMLFSPDGQTLAGDIFTLHCPTCSEAEGLGRYMVLWRLSDGAIISKIEHPSGWMAYSSDGSSVAVFTTESVQIVKAADGSPIASIDGFTAPVVGMALAPQGDTLASAHALDPYTLRFWELSDGQVVRTLQGSNNASAETGMALAYSPDGNYLAVRGDIWDLAAGEQLTEMEQAITAVTSCWATGVAFAPETDALATGCFEGQLDLWSVPDGASLKRIGGYSSSVDDLAYSPDGKSIAAVYGVPDYLVQVWKIPSGEPAFKLTGGHFTRVVYSPDGSKLATVMANEEYDQFGHPAGYVQIWSGANGEQIRQLDLNDAVSLAFSPDDQILATGSFDGTLRLWEVASGRLLVETRGHSASIQRLIFTPDGARLISGSSDGTISLWGIPQ